MSDGKIGIWLIGAWGGVSTTVATGLAALQQRLTDETGLVSALPRFAGLNFAGWDRFTVGGHEIRRTCYAAEAQRLFEDSHVFSAALLDDVAGTLQAFDRNIRTGTLINVGPTIESIASAETAKTRGERPTTAIERIARDLNEFRETNNLAHVVVVNLSSTEPPLTSDAAQLSWPQLAEVLESSTRSPLPASSLYGIAALSSGCSYVNFTPSIGTDIPALHELALEKQALHVGRDGKTGETLLKSVLAPMFAARNLQVMSWVGHNIFGNMDGKVLDDPTNKANKVRSKDHLLTEILGYKPQSLVSIEYIESMADWKTAWDHIHFRGFLQTPMTMQFTWQGCDSLLAAPLVLDLVRFTEREWRRSQGVGSPVGSWVGSGVMTHLSSFFKSPMGENIPPEFHNQYTLLEEWADAAAAET